MSMLLLVFGCQRNQLPEQSGLCCAKALNEQSYPCSIKVEAWEAIKSLTALFWGEQSSLTPFFNNPSDSRMQCHTNPQNFSAGSHQPSTSDESDMRKQSIKSEVQAESYYSRHSDSEATSSTVPELGSGTSSVLQEPHQAMTVHDQSIRSVDRRSPQHHNGGHAGGTALVNRLYDTAPPDVSEPSMSVQQSNSVNRNDSFPKYDLFDDLIPELGNGTALMENVPPQHAQPERTGYANALSTGSQLHTRPTAVPQDPTTAISLTILPPVQHGDAQATFANHNRPLRPEPRIRLPHN